MEKKLYARKIVQIDAKSAELIKGYELCVFIPDYLFPELPNKVLGYIPKVVEPDIGFYIRLEPDERKSLVKFLEIEKDRLEERMQDHEPGSWFYNKDLDDLNRVRHLQFLFAEEVNHDKEDA